ncbi:MAG: response regulator [Planctomycetaceae bacterium]|nr:response regulator [Planctomycetaceae bacterium]
MSTNVLVVDDSAVVRAMIIKTLRMAGVDLGEVFEAGNGREGIETLQDKWVDLVFADLNMPEVNGEEMIDRMRANPVWADLPVVVISTEGSQTRIDRLRQKGAKFIHKPFSPEQIRDVVTPMIGAAL